MNRIFVRAILPPGAKLALAAMLLAGSVGCRFPSPSPEPIWLPVTVKGSIDAAGGTLTHPDGAELVVPPDALTAPVELSITGYPSTANLASAFGTVPFRGGSDFGPSGQQFLVPVTMRLPFPGGFRAGEQVGLYIHDAGTGHWVEQTGGAVVATDGASVQASVSHFCAIAPLAIPAEALTRIGSYLAIFEPSVALGYYVPWFVDHTHAVGYTFTHGDTIYKQVGLAVDVMYQVGADSGHLSYSNQWETDLFTTLSSAHDVLSVGGGDPISYDICVTLFYEGSDSSRDERFPYVSILNPQPIQSVSGPTLIGTYTERAVSVAFYADGLLLGTDTEAPYSWTWDSDSATEGQHTLNAVAADGDGDSCQDSVTVVKSAGPIVVDVRPVDGAGEVPVQTTVTLTFSKPMNKAAAETAFSITPTAAGSFEWPAGNRMTFVPTGNLDDECLYTVGVGTGAMDSGGHSLWQAWSASFTTQHTVNVAIEGGSYSSFALKSDGTLWGWGSNTKGQLGDGTTSTRLNPVQVGGLTGVTAVSSGECHTIALKSDGTVWAWGNNTYGQRGDASSDDQLTPMQVSGLSGMTAVGAGDWHTLALQSDGTVWSWGLNDNGQLGDDTPDSRWTPTRVEGLSGVKAISAGAHFSLALKADGSVWAWGCNQQGQLGNGTTVDSESPVQVIGLSGVGAVSAGASHSVVLMGDATLKAWGDNESGQLGDGTKLDRLIPVQVVGLNGVKSLSAGYGHTLASRTNCTAWAWGLDCYGQVGVNPAPQDPSVPIQIVDLSGVALVSASLSHSLAMQSDGTIWAWGLNTDGRLGDGTQTQRLTPVQVMW